MQISSDPVNSVASAGQVCLLPRFRNSSERMPVDLKRGDALLGIHWYAVAIGYLSSVKTHRGEQRKNVGEIEQ